MLVQVDSEDRKGRVLGFDDVRHTDPRKVDLMPTTVKQLFEALEIPKLHKVK